MNLRADKNEDEDSSDRLLEEFDGALRQLGETGAAAQFQTPVKMLPKHGVFFRWPAQGIEQLVHPDDVGVATQMMPGSRVFELRSCPDVADQEAGYSMLQYGQFMIRIRPAMWLRVDDQGYRVGDRVEVLSRNGQREPVIGQIVEVSYNPIARQIEYRIETKGMVLNRTYRKEDFRPCRRLGEPLGRRAQGILNAAAVSF